MAIAEAIRHNSRTALRHLDLCGNEISDKGSRAISDMLAGNTTLLSLSLGITSLTFCTEGIIYSDQHDWAGRRGVPCERTDREPHARPA